MSRKKGQCSGSKDSEDTAAAVQGCGPAPPAPAKVGQCWAEGAPAHPLRLRAFCHQLPLAELRAQSQLYNPNEKF